ncbi:TMhelix containing protein [Vibrio phage 1.039.O._10N.286.55.A2]|nr:TMhelix containing protein [Vibrio phage 1.003.O._10N.286.48.A2]AUR83559.1 TMhelix containing protein [Vibrio phage 1.036.O._10N.286.45.C3]AUR83766.1 TMhelix containing protein [Vibrio phage 1.039.O._10N.286.55.A2]AUR84645.1 TMhelix containing protein [Vibrio phage 1.061.O._10N.286.55.C2]AUR85089.1 TMhelix containing protein [Vibrio phage 1.067.O._10N.261.52.C9]AUR85715.1 TMhelix containing protein [Vibrio phage 1.079.O._10N.286.45.E9]AUR86899.1 TMhelix containing protein [Vibrio phage 1.0
MSDDRERISRIERQQDELGKMHAETLSKMGELVTEFRVSNENTKHINKDIEELKQVTKSNQDSIHNIEKQQAESKPMIEIVKNLNNKLWGLIVTAIGGCMIVVYSLQSGG